MSIPRDEIKRRQILLGEKLLEEGIQVAVLRYPLNIYYFSGCFVDGHLIITEKAQSFLLVYRSLERARQEAQVDEIIPFRSLKNLPKFLKDGGWERIGLEEDRLPAKVFRYYKSLLAGFLIEDLSSLIWSIRALKSPYELECVSKAALMLSKTIEDFLPFLRPGVTELEAAGQLEALLRLRGHPAHNRVYQWTQELAYGHLLFGDSGAVPSYTTTGQGGLGVEGFPQGPSFRKLSPEDIIVLDYAGWYRGYMVDQTRLFSFSPPKDLLDVYEKILELMSSLEELLKPGVLIASIYEKAWEEAVRLGLEEHFMRHGQERVPFVGHGVGLEIDEWPPIAKGVKDPLQEGMVIALEPKCHFPGKAEIGLEDTFFISASGPKRLTLSPRKLRILSF